MIGMDAVFLCTSDISGKLRGKAVPGSAANPGLIRWIGWTPTNVQITCFDDIAPSPYGALGDLVLEAGEGDPHVCVRDQDFAADLAIGRLLELDGTPWCCCTRNILETALFRLKRCSGLQLRGAFEQEFHFCGGPQIAGEGFSLRGFRRERAFCEAVLGVLTRAGIQPASILREYGPDQFEVTLEPATGDSIAHQAVLVRELVSAVADWQDRQVTFAPLISPGGMGNGVHIHLSLLDRNGRPCSHDPEGRHGMSRATGAFIAGILRHLPSILCLLAPSVVSYERLSPHRWSAAYNNLGRQDREASVRLAPVRMTDETDPADQFNFEIRACDAAASPYLALAAIVHAGADGIESGMTPPEPTREDLSLLAADELEARGIRRLPESLAAALDEFEADGTVRSWFRAPFPQLYLDHKRTEIDSLAGRSPKAICGAYQSAY